MQREGKCARLHECWPELCVALAIHVGPLAVRAPWRELAREPPVVQALDEAVHPTKHSASSSASLWCFWKTSQTSDADAWCSVSQSRHWSSVRTRSVFMVHRLLFDRFAPSPGHGDRTCSASAIESWSACRMTSAGTHSGKGMRRDRCAPVGVCSLQTLAR